MPFLSTYSHLGFSTQFYRKSLLPTLVLCLGLSAPLCYAQSSSPPALPEAAHRTYAQNYKDSALAYCISIAYKNEAKASLDASHTAGAIDVWGQYDLENSTTKIPALVNQYLSRTYHSKHDNDINYNLMKCIDLYHGPELEELVRLYVPEPNGSYKIDNSDTLKKQD
ncbi:MAG: T6SS amidase immunity protein Tai4 family protein [Pelistega sp.]|nr:T6SS amidase immunity protein Tai4 family protein [Pelistega sp.]